MEMFLGSARKAARDYSIFRYPAAGLLPDGDEDIPEKETAIPGKELQEIFPVSILENRKKNQTPKTNNMSKNRGQSQTRKMVREQSGQQNKTPIRGRDRNLKGMNNYQAGGGMGHDSMAIFTPQRKKPKGWEKQQRLGL